MPPAGVAGSAGHGPGRWHGPGPAPASDPAGKVVDGEGKPVAGVTVSAIGRSWADPAVSASATTGPDGRFVLSGAWKLEELDLRYLGLFARARDGRCGWVSTVWREQPSSQDLTIELGDVADVAARLVDHEGKPLPNVMVKLDILDRSEREKGLYDEVVLPRSLASAVRGSYRRRRPVRRSRASRAGRRSGPWSMSRSSGGRWSSGTPPRSARWSSTAGWGRSRAGWFRPRARSFAGASSLA